MIKSWRSIYSIWQELNSPKLRNAGFEDDRIRETISDFSDDDLNERNYLVNFEGKNRKYRNHFSQKRQDDKNQLKDNVLYGRSGVLVPTILHSIHTSAYSLLVHLENHIMKSTVEIIAKL